MGNLIACIIALVLGIYLSIWEHKANFVLHSKYLMLFVAIVRVFLFFGVGFFASETIKYFNGLPTFIF